MNAPTTTAAIAKPTVDYLALAAIKPSSTHIQQLRRERFDKKALQELADSIKSMGILQPVVVRPIGLGNYELVAAEREGRMLAERIVDEVRARNRELETNIKEKTCT